MAGDSRPYLGTMRAATLLGLMAGVLTTVSFVPQVVKTWRTRSARDISGGMLALFGAGVLLWIVYGVSLRDAPIIIANVVTLALALVIVGLKLRYR